MAQRKTKRKTTKRKTTRKRRSRKGKNSFWIKFKGFCGKRKLNIIGLIFLLIAGLGFFSLGMAGTLFANVFRLVVGNAYQVLAIFLGLFGGLLFLGIKIPKIDFHYIVGFLVAFVGWTLNLSILFFNSLNTHVGFVQTTFNTLFSDITSNVSTSNVGGGMVGASLLSLFSTLISLLGTSILAYALMVIGVVIFFKLPVIQWAKDGLSWTGKWITSMVASVRRAHINNNERRKQKKSQEQPSHVVKKASVNSSVLKRPESSRTQEQPQALHDSLYNSIKSQDTNKSDEKAPHITVASRKPKPIQSDSRPEADSPKFDSNSTNDRYQLPSTKLLTKVPEQDQTEEYNAIDKNTQILQKTLKSFGVDAEVKNVSLGPSVTEYELHPAIGVKVSKIVNLSDDIALALAAKDIRIEAPIPGKSLIGIEVPNKSISTVSFRDVFENQTGDTKSILNVPLGKNVNGDVVSCDITKMPHLLIAGSTGSGKSVAINSILTSILLKATPDQVKFMLIDPKKVELGVYNGIPHLLSPVVSDPKKAARVLHKVVDEMEHRYEMFAQTGQRKISGYNKYIREKNASEGTSLPTLPYIVVVVDELADLMMTVSNEVESAIIRLAQMGRAAGVHMILATQRPSVDVITGLIKANVPSRIAFAVSSGVDSRTILDTNGAEKLLGRGDMLYLPIDQNIPARVQGSFISDSDVENVVDFVKKQARPEYDDSMMVTDAEIKEEEKNDDEDDLFDDALAFVIKEQKASTSMIQRQFRIGYNRAARIIDDMEQRGYIGPQHGSKPRDVYKKSSDDAEQ
ncbi:DNA segregation ATPase FtsK SpoIIIE related protein [Fructilactobacillus fructivorans]|uniref:FtsK/SpoIIIE family DNA translocase n=1 Tax=Fructilactobacillus fructivorans TaxID=1614 RepID=UPI0007051B4E|nr:DNA translocase FtsK [Fructilactobacillus fructivorans]KRN13743.1 DNA segregation ATPase FtsK SpoIIIE related protein [Fructilactobacillus fructivorans]